MVDCIPILYSHRDAEVVWLMPTGQCLQNNSTDMIPILMGYKYHNMINHIYLIIYIYIYIVNHGIL